MHHRRHRMVRGAANAHQTQVAITNDIACPDDLPNGR